MTEKQQLILEILQKNISDVVMQAKHLGYSFDQFEFQNNKTLIDVLNVAEKRELMDSCEHFLEIREARNEIEHEYLSANLYKLYAKALDYGAALLKCCDKLGCI